MSHEDWTNSRHKASAICWYNNFYARFDRDSTQVLPTQMNSPVTLSTDDIRLALSRVNVRKAAGPDGLPGCVLEACFAYRPNRSTEDAISMAMHSTLTHLDNNNNTYARMLFIDFSSGFNAVIPSKLGCVLSPLFYTLFTHNCMPVHGSNSIIKFDTTVIGLINNKDESAYRDEVQQLAMCSTASKQKALRRVVKTIQYITGAQLTAIQDQHKRSLKGHVASAGTAPTPTMDRLLPCHLVGVCVLLYVFLCSLSVITICGNLLVLISVIYFKQLHTPTNSLILSLAVADLLVGVSVFPFTMEFSASLCLYSEHLFCTVRESFEVTLCTASILNLCCISIDRYYAVCHPLTYRTKINVHVVVIMILVSWSVSLLVAIGLVIAGLNQDKCKDTGLNQVKCFLDVQLANSLGLFCTFYLPVILMLCIYLKIFLVAQRQVRSIQGTKSGATASKMERKATKTLVIVMGVFLICWTPFFLCVSIQLLNYVSVPAAAIESLGWLALSNSMLNPFIYAFFYSWFRSAFRMIISRKIFQGDFSNTKLL
ncbi:trace amine-associated receptor 1-like [Chaetodon auriga]|uniref:trace amine-associated receptor 1-like n=1 Tax=Chaetodon auriga TaxID=39042 RepID=UPI004032CA45